MAYIREYGTSDFIQSYHPLLSYDCVRQFSRDWSLGEVDTYDFSLFAPKTPLQVGHLYEIFADGFGDRKIGMVYLMGLNPTTYKGHPEVTDDVEGIHYHPFGAGPTTFLKMKRINVRKSNIRISDFVKLVITKADLPHGIGNDLSMVQPDDFVTNVKFVAKTAWEVLIQLRQWGYDFFVDDNLKFHFFRTEQNVLGYQFDDDNAFLEKFDAAPDITLLKNAVMIQGKEKASPAPPITIIGTGDLLTGLDYQLPNNVIFSEELNFTTWADIDTNIWSISDSMGSTHPDSPDGSRYWLGNSALISDGGDGVQGANFVEKTQPMRREAGSALIQSLSFDQFGDGFILAHGDGNGAAEVNLFGVFLRADGTLSIREAGIEIEPASPMPIKRSFSGSDGLQISNLTPNKKTFDLPTGFGQYFQTGETIQIIGTFGGFGAYEGIIQTLSTDTLTMQSALPNSDITDAKLNRVVDYRIKIEVQEIGYRYFIQGGPYGPINSGIYTEIATTATDATEFLFPVPSAPKDAGCRIAIDATLVLPTGGASFTRGNEVLLVAPEGIGSNFDIPILIREADPRQNPALFRYRPQRYTASVFGGTATVSELPVTENDFDNIYIGDRLLAEKQETFVTGKNPTGFKISIAPDLISVPVDGVLIFVGTTAAALGQNGTFNYSFPIQNIRFFRDEPSIALYGLIDAEPIVDQTLETSEDIKQRWEAFRQEFTQPKVSGTAVFDVIPLLGV